MCELSYVACGGCDQPASELRWIEVYDRAERLVHSVDEDGDSRGDGEYEDCGESNLSNSYFECPHCGWEGNNLDQECVPDYCECRECQPPEPDEEPPDHQRDEIVLLVRSDDSQRIDLPEDAPPELVRLLTDRTISRFPVPRWRATQIYTRWLDCEDDVPVGVNFDTDDVSEELVQDLLLPYDYDVPEENDPEQIFLRLTEEVNVGA